MKPSESVEKAKKMRRTWKSEHNRFARPIMCYFTKNQMRCVIAEAESRKMTLIDVIREALNQRYQIDSDL